MKPSEVAIDFIHTSHEHFAAGIFWINCRKPELIEASIGYIEKVKFVDYVFILLRRAAASYIIIIVHVVMYMLYSGWLLFGG